LMILVKTVAMGTSIPASSRQRSNRDAPVESAVGPSLVFDPLRVIGE
jgi:hypothetical protein